MASSQESENITFKDVMDSINYLVEGITALGTRFDNLENRILSLENKSPSSTLEKTPPVPPKESVPEAQPKDLPKDSLPASEPKDSPKDVKDLPKASLPASEPKDLPKDVKDVKKDNPPKATPQPTAAKQQETVELDESEPSDHSKKGRRSSMFQMGDDSSKEDVTTIRTQPSYSHIQLKKIKLWYAVEFLRACEEFQDTTNTKIKNVGSLLSRSAQKDLIAKNYGELDSSSIGKLTLTRIGTYLQKACQPISQIQFQDFLNKYVDFELSKSYSPSILNYPQFRDALLELRESFMYFYSFMSGANESRNVPEVSNRKGGLIRIFLDKIHFEYGHNLFQELTIKTFDKLEDFMDKFYALVAMEMKTSEKARITMLHFSGVVTGRKLSDRVQVIESSDKITSEKLLKKLAESDDSDGLSDSDGDEIDQQIQAMSGVSPKKELLRKDSKSKPQAEKEKRGCPSMLFSKDGKCQRQSKGIKCSYLHDRPSLEGAHEYYMKLLFNSQFKPNSQRVNAVLKELGYSNVFEESDDDPSKDY